MAEMIVIKLGTASITNDGGKLNVDNLQKVVADVAALHRQGLNIVLVSSGAVGNGRAFLKNYKGTTQERKAAAAVGNPILINKYAEAFAKHDIIIAQTLLERWHFSNRKHFLQLRDTVEALWENKIIPIANENDVVSDLEIRFSDNDHLATLLAAGFGASKLLIGSSVEGILDHDGQVIREITDPEETMKSFVKDEKSSMGLGGMATKLSYASLAARLGIQATIFGLKGETPILNAYNGEVGSRFKAGESSKDARSMWLASGSLASGCIEVDKGAKEALLNRKSLLQVGITDIERAFNQGEIVEIRHKHKQIAVGIAKISSKDVKVGEKENNLVVIHANNLVVI